MAKFTELEVRIALGEALVCTVELEAEIGKLKQGLHPNADEMDDCTETLHKCRDSNVALSSQSEARMQTIRDQDKEIANLKEDKNAFIQDLQAASSQIRILQQKLKK